MAASPNMKNSGTLAIGVSIGLATLAAFAAASLAYRKTLGSIIKKKRRLTDEELSEDGEGEPDFSVLPCLLKRRSIFPRQYAKDAPIIDSRIVESMLQAAMWAPFHGPAPPWRFVVLGKDAMVRMQELTLMFYDKNWQRTGFPGSSSTASSSDYEKWRTMTEREVTGFWGPVSYMIAIIMQRQASPAKRLPEWEEMAATACAVQNMHIQTSKFPGLACYWSSWHDAARDSEEMKKFLGMQAEDRCLGFFMVAACQKNLTDRRRRKAGTHLLVEWRA